MDEELSALSFNGPGDYRLRIHARGRDTATDLAQTRSRSATSYRHSQHPGGMREHCASGQLRRLRPSRLIASDPADARAFDLSDRARTSALCCRPSLEEGADLQATARGEFMRSVAARTRPDADVANRRLIAPLGPAPATWAQFPDHAAIRHRWGQAKSKVWVIWSGAGTCRAGRLGHAGSRQLTHSTHCRALPADGLHRMPASSVRTDVSGARHRVHSVARLPAAVRSGLLGRCACWASWRTGCAASARSSPA